MHTTSWLRGIKVLALAFATVCLFHGAPGGAQEAQRVKTVTLDSKAASAGVTKVGVFRESVSVRRGETLRVRLSFDSGYTWLDMTRNRGPLALIGSLEGTLEDIEPEPKVPNPRQPPGEKPQQKGGEIRPPSRPLLGGTLLAPQVGEREKRGESLPFYGRPQYQTFTFRAAGQGETTLVFFELSPETLPERVYQVKVTVK